MIIFFLLASFVSSTFAQVIPVKWSQLPGAAVEISSKGKELWVINDKQQIFRWEGTNWKQIPGVASRVGASPDGWTWVVNSAGNVFRFNVDKQDWDLMPGGIVQISAMSKDRAIGIAPGNSIWLWDKTAWTQLPGGATWSAIGDGDERWVIHQDTMQIFRWSHSGNTWEVIPGGATWVDVQNPCRVMVTNIHNQMFIRKNNAWSSITGSGSRATLNEKHFFAVNSANEIFKGEFKDDENACPPCEQRAPAKNVHKEKDETDVVVIYREEEIQQ